MIGFSEQMNLVELEKRSMLFQASEYFNKYKDKFWFGNHSFSSPQTNKLLNEYSVWLDLYPAATLTDIKNNQSILDVYSNPKLIEILANIGIKVIHTNPMQQAGSLSFDLYQYPSCDGGYDRIDYKIDNNIGYNDQYCEFVNNSAEKNILVAGDIIPGHTGIGADFLLAVMNYKNYSNLFVMQEIREEDWSILPNINIDTNTNSEKLEVVNLNDETVQKLINKNYIPGTMELVFFKQPGIKETNWSVTQEVVGVDGQKRRWLYLHWFKQGQPSLNWSDPSFSAQQLLLGDIVQHRFELGTKVLRLDANAMLGLEKISGQENIWSVGHPLSSLCTKQLAMLMRKLGGYTYEENNSDLQSIKIADEMGPDLSYDFSLRTGYIHAIATGDASLLKLQYGLVKQHGVNLNRLIHALQNHDNLCYELFHFDKYPDEEFSFKAQKLKAKDINKHILDEVKQVCSIHSLPFKLSYGGIQAHFVELIAARLNIAQDRLKNRSLLSHTEYQQIKQLMLLAVFFNAMQPGVFQLSAWDLLGMVHQNEQELGDYLSDGDTRWLCRSGFDLLGDNYAQVEKTSSGIPKGYNLFGDLSEQKDDSDSFINQLSNLLKIREQLQIATSEFVDIIDVSHESINTILLKNNNSNKYYFVVNNFGNDNMDISNDVNNYIRPQSNVIEHMTQRSSINTEMDFNIPGYSGRIYEIDKR